MATVNITTHDGSTESLEVPGDFKLPPIVDKQWLTLEGSEGKLTLHPGVIKTIFVRNN